MIVGIPKEIMTGEARVAATPETVEKFVSEGITVLVEAGAGENSLYSNQEYKDAGAKLIGDTQLLYSQSDLILKVKEPLFNERIGSSDDSTIQRNKRHRCPCHIRIKRAVIV